MNQEEVNFCLRCGSALLLEEKSGEMRPACPDCGWIYFPDPKVAVAVLIENADGVLFVQRDNNPRRGLWTLPAGFVDAGEDPALAAAREVLEETSLVAAIQELLGVIPVREHKEGADLLIAYRGEVKGGNLQAGDDAARVGFFPPGEFPPLAFRSTWKILTWRKEK